MHLYIGSEKTITITSSIFGKDGKKKLVGTIVKFSRKINEKEPQEVCLSCDGNYYVTNDNTFVDWFNSTISSIPRVEISLKDKTTCVIKDLRNTKTHKVTFTLTQE